jgi:hypothetical protein
MKHSILLTNNAIEAGVYTLIWSTTEVNVAIICTSLLVLKPLLIRWFPCLMADPVISAREQAKQVSDALRGLSGSTLDEEKGRWWKSKLSNIGSTGGRKKNSVEKEGGEAYESFRRQSAFARELGEILMQDVPAVEQPYAGNYLRQFRELQIDERFGWYR